MKKAKKRAKLAVRGGLQLRLLRSDQFDEALKSLMRQSAHALAVCALLQSMRLRTIPRLLRVLICDVLNE